jgi:hypothetical protein
MLRYVAALTGISIMLCMPAVSQTVAYDSLVHEGNLQLQSGNNEQAVTAANSAIKLDATRSEGCAIACGALMNLKRYDEAADQLGNAIAQAPDAKPTGSDLQKQRQIAESGAAPPAGQVDSAPSLVDGLATLEHMVSLEKTIAINFAIHDNVNGKNLNGNATFPKYFLIGSAASCMIAYGIGSPEGPNSSVFSYKLREITKVGVESPEAHLTEAFGAAGHNATVSSVQPRFTVVQVWHGPERNQMQAFHFLDTENANHFARTFAQAVKLCGGNDLELILAQAPAVSQPPGPAVRQQSVPPRPSPRQVILQDSGR